MPIHVFLLYLKYAAGIIETRAWSHASITSYHKDETTSFFAQLYFLIYCEKISFFKKKIVRLRSYYLIVLENKMRY